MDAPIYISRQSQQLGPFPESQIQDMINSGMLSPSDLFWKEGNSEWEPISHVFRRTSPPPVVHGTGSRPQRLNRFSGIHPGFWLRFLAHFIDLFLICVAASIVVILSFLAMASLGVADEIILGGILAIVNIVVAWLYYALFESSSEQATPGKMVCGFVVTGMNGKRISFDKASGRYFGKVISMLIFPIGFVMCAFTQKKQCLHDVMAGCLMYMKNS